VPPCRVTKADLPGVDLLEQLQRQAAVLHQDVRGGSGTLDLDAIECLDRVPINCGGATGWGGATGGGDTADSDRCSRRCCW